ncbi:hypothetical protein RJ639_014560 [Escallonia herrerae]|uniref:Uncharacterized protein n=1 Tax=Escallonia herrerae TaxID=1293975 RepID=A0AA88VF13_9ASTE|nr:hypothetical protein RJ639_014560 [Escallonia herrerae]
MEDTFSRKVIIWVAKRGKPVIGTTADVTMDTDGILQIIHEDVDPIPLNSKDQAAKNSSATLTDSGNFVLTEWNLDGSVKRVLWQTFDYPVDTLLPGMKLGENFQTGKKWSLSSWISDRVPAPGTFTLEWNYTENGRGQLVTRRRGEVYWTSGLLNVADQSFENIVWLCDDYYRDIYNFTVVSSENESYFTYSVPNGNMTMLVLNSDQSNGTLIDSDRREFGPSGLCNGVDHIPGCEAERPPECRSSNETFKSRAGQFVGGRYLNDGNMSLGFSDCWAQCRNNCSCAGYNASYLNGAGCQLWNVEANFQQDLSGSQGMIYVLNSRLNVTSPNSGHSSNSEIEEKHQEEVLLELTTSERFDPKEIGSGGKYKVKVFSFASIMAATNDFSSENKVGQGGFGPVFKGRGELVGYMSPEYAMEGIFSEKSDVYSFGVLMLEIVSGQKNSGSFSRNDHPINLVGYVWESWREGSSLKLVDPMLGDSSSSINQISRCLHVGLLCVQENAVERPLMSDIICMLTNESMPQPTPKFQLHTLLGKTGRSSVDVHIKKPQSNQLNTPTKENISSHAWANVDCTALFPAEIIVSVPFRF